MPPTRSGSCSDFRDPPGHGVRVEAFGQQHHELVAAEPGHGVVRPDAVAQPVGNLDQQLIGGRTAQHVVEALRVIQVQQQHIHRVRTAQRRGQALVEQGAVGQRGQRIAQHPGPELVIVLGKGRGHGSRVAEAGRRTGRRRCAAAARCRPAGDGACACMRTGRPPVPHAADRERDGPLFRTRRPRPVGGQHRAGDLDGDFGAVGAAAGAGEGLAGPRRAAAPRPARTAWKSSAGGLGQQQAGVGAQQLGAGVAEELLRGCIQEGNGSVRREQQQRVRGVFQQ